MFPARWVQAGGAKRFCGVAPVGPLLCAGLLTLTLACAGGAPEPVQACLTLEGSENLNLYDGQAHAVTLYLYPLNSKLGFEEASIQDLLEGNEPAGSVGKPVPITIGPGEQREFNHALPPSAAFVGIVADYYRGPGDPEGERRIVVPAKCSFLRTKRITLLPQELAEGN